MGLDIENMPRAGDFRVNAAQTLMKSKLPDHAFNLTLQHTKETSARNYQQDDEYIYQLAMGELHEGEQPFRENVSDDWMQGPLEQSAIDMERRANHHKAVAKSISTRTRLPAQLRNEILFNILELRDPEFTKLLLTNMPSNIGGRKRKNLFWNNSLLAFIVMIPDLFTKVKIFLAGCQDLADFSQIILNGLKSWDRQHKVKFFAWKRNQRTLKRTQIQEKNQVQSQSQTQPVIQENTRNPLPEFPGKIMGADACEYSHTSN